MIITMFLNIIYYFVWLVTRVITLFDNVEVGSELTEAIQNLNKALVLITQIFSIETIQIIFWGILLIEGFIALFKLGMWIIRRFPTQS